MPFQLSCTVKNRVHNNDISKSKIWYEYKICTLKYNIFKYYYTYIDKESYSKCKIKAKTLICYNNLL